MTKLTIKQAAALKAVALTNVAHAALTEGGAGNATDAAIVAALNGKRAYDKNGKATALAGEILDSAMLGFMAARFRKAGDNRPDADLLAYAAEARKALNADGTGTLKTGQRRRTKLEQAAYDAAKMARSRLLKRAGLAPLKVASNGGKRKPGGQTTAKEAPVPTLPKNVVPLIPPARKDMTAERLAAWLGNVANAAVSNCELAMQVADKTGNPAPSLAIVNAATAFREAMNKALKG